MVLLRAAHQRQGKGSGMRCGLLQQSGEIVPDIRQFAGSGCGYRESDALRWFFALRWVRATGAGFLIRKSFALRWQVGGFGLIHQLRGNWRGEATAVSTLQCEGGGEMRGSVGFGLFRQLG